MPLTDPDRSGDYYLRPATAAERAHNAALLLLRLAEVRQANGVPHSTPYDLGGYSLPTAPPPGAEICLTSQEGPPVESALPTLDELVDELASWDIDA